MATTCNTCPQQNGRETQGPNTQPGQRRVHPVYFMCSTDNTEDSKPKTRSNSRTWQLSWSCTAEPAPGPPDTRETLSRSLRCCSSRIPLHLCAPTAQFDLQQRHRDSVERQMKTWQNRHVRNLVASKYCRTWIHSLGKPLVVETNNCCISCKWARKKFSINI